MLSSSAGLGSACAHGLRFPCDGAAAVVDMLAADVGKQNAATGEGRASWAVRSSEVRASESIGWLLGSVRGTGREWGDERRLRTATRRGFDLRGELFFAEESHLEGPARAATAIKLDSQLLSNDPKC